MIRAVIVVGAALGLTWIALVVLLAAIRPSELTLREAARLLPDTARLVRRLATDGSVPLGVRVRLWLLAAYLAMPIDLVPDFIPVVGQADDVVIVVATLRGVIRSTDAATLRRHWPGSDDGLEALLRLTSHPGPPRSR